MTYRLVFGENLQQLIREHSVTEIQVTELCGVDKDTVRRWIKGDRLITLKHLLPIVEYFQCSLDYILGRTDKFLDFVPQPCPPFYESIEKVLLLCGKTKYRMKMDIQIYDSYYLNWKKGKSPHILTLAKIANYLGCSVDNLAGRESLK